MFPLTRSEGALFLFTPRSAGFTPALAVQLETRAWVNTNTKAKRREASPVFRSHPKLCILCYPCRDVWEENLMSGREAIPSHGRLRITPYGVICESWDDDWPISHSIT